MVKSTVRSSQKSRALTLVNDSLSLFDRWSLACGVVMIGRSRRSDCSTFSSKWSLEASYYDDMGPLGMLRKLYIARTHDNGRAGWHQCGGDLLGSPLGSSVVCL